MSDVFMQVIEIGNKLGKALLENILLIAYTSTVERLCFTLEIGKSIVNYGIW